ncbi:hypothetical protein RI129_010034 [Pyrocoelia pectoralis]|uniref:Peptidase metallopeptidase domain-containing protein n=1 Tax=Pyrocoelia pectoralis TaxID=417401 RepID=A0AAN7V5W9_9COLE
MCDCNLFHNFINMLFNRLFKHFGSSFSVLLIILICALQGFAVPDRHKRELIEDDVQSYLMQFGYLTPMSTEAGALRTEESVRQAISELQQFSGLPVTGKLDEKTKMLMKKPRCGVPDIEPHNMRRKRFTIQGQKWPYNNITWSLRSTYLRDLDRYQVRYVFTKALEVWSKHSKLTFTEVDSDRADVLVYFHRYEHGDNFAFDGKGQILAHAFFPGSGRGGDAHFDLDESWIIHEDDTSDGTSLFHVAAHEFGHSLGLSHSSVEGALMFPWYQGMQNGFNYELPEDDRLGIQTLYGSQTDQMWGHNPPFHPPLQTPPPPTRPPTPRPHHQFGQDQHAERQDQIIQIIPKDLTTPKNRKIRDTLKNLTPKNQFIKNRCHPMSNTHIILTIAVETTRPNHLHVPKRPMTDTTRRNVQKPLRTHNDIQSTIIQTIILRKVQFLKPVILVTTLFRLFAERCSFLKIGISGVSAIEVLYLDIPLMLIVCGKIYRKT